MKEANFLLFQIILLFGIFTAKAQPYPSIFGTEKTQFNIFVPCMGMKGIVEDCIDPELGEGYTKHISFRQGNDTIINNITYQIGAIPYSGGIFHDAYIREDTLTGKIYSYFPKCNEEYLVCDLSLNVGDTFYVHKCTYLGIQPDGYMIADSVVTVKGKKVIYFNAYAGYGNHKVFFMEGIGSIFGFLENMYECRLKFNVLLCVHKDEELVYIRNSESSYDCDYNCMFSSVNENTKSKLSVIPNPVSNEFYIQSDLINIDEIFIYNFQGQCVSQIKLKEEFQKINIAALNTGIYLLKAKDIRGNIYTTKIIKL